jgi:FkbM family methyltransferase
LTPNTNIIKLRGSNRKHSFLEKLAKSKDFPTRLRLFNIFLKLWDLTILKATTPSGIKLALDVTDWVQYQIYFFGNYEKKSVALFKQLSASAEVIFDIGAHIGQYALESAQLDAELSKRIFAIEVNPKTFTYLLNNIQLNQFYNVTPVLGAVSNTSEVLNISIPAYWNMGNTQINEGADVNDKSSNYLAAAFTIEDILNKYKLTHIDLIKIDVEGYEYEVLNSLVKKNTYPKHILFEYIPDAFLQASKTIFLLKEMGYTVKHIDGTSFDEDNTDVIEFNLWAQKTN